MKLISVLLLLSTASSAGGNSTVPVTSPDGQTTAVIETSAGLSFSVIHKGTTVIWPSQIGMTVNGTTLEKGAAIGKTLRREVRDTLVPVVPSYNSRIPDRYNEAEILLAKEFGVIVRVYDDGAAYR